VRFKGALQVAEVVGQIEVAGRLRALLRGADELAEVSQIGSRGRPGAAEILAAVGIDARPQRVQPPHEVVRQRAGREIVGTGAHAIDRGEYVIGRKLLVRPGAVSNWRSFSARAGT
jgi:hypothetical protein